MKFARLAAIVVLAFLGVGAVGGAVPLILDPSGRMMGMPFRFLRYTPFPSFLIPGLLLLVSNGVLCAWVLYLAVKRRPGYRLVGGLSGLRMFWLDRRRGSAVARGRSAALSLLGSWAGADCAGPGAAA